MTLILTFSSLVFAQYYPPGRVGFYSEVGVQIGKDLKTVPVGQSITGVVDNPEKLATLGYQGAKKGDKVMIMNVGDGNWKLKIMSTGQEKPFHLKK